MLYINEKSVVGKTYFYNNEEWNCIGYGENPRDARMNYFIGTRFDSVNNRTVVAPHMLKDVQFKGTLPL